MPVYIAPRAARVRPSASNHFVVEQSNTRPTASNPPGLGRRQATAEDDELGMGPPLETEPLGPGEIRLPQTRPSPLMGMGHWASQLTTDYAQFPDVLPEIPSRMNSTFEGDDEHDPPLGMEQHLSNLLEDDEDPHEKGLTHGQEDSQQAQTALVTSSGVPVVVERDPGQPNLGEILSVLLFPPPPPPPDSDVPDPTNGLARSVMHKRMMRWYQVTELWCSEVGVEDCQRAIVAPPPRPPPFADTHGVIPSSQSLPAPYSFDRWMAQCRRWWAHVATQFDILRNASKFATLQHVSYGPVIRTDLATIYHEALGFQQV